MLYFAKYHKTWYIFEAQACIFKLCEKITMAPPFDGNNIIKYALFLFADFVVI